MAAGVRRAAREWRDSVASTTTRVHNFLYRRNARALRHRLPLKCFTLRICARCRLFPRLERLNDGRIIGDDLIVSPPAATFVKVGRSVPVLCIGAIMPSAIVEGVIIDSALFAANSFFTAHFQRKKIVVVAVVKSRRSGVAKLGTADN